MANDPKIAESPSDVGVPPGGTQRGPIDGFRIGGSKSNNPFVPILLLGVAVLLVVGAQTGRLWQERALLDTALEGQKEAFEQSKLLRLQLDGVAADTVRLARRGNQNAAKVVEELAKLGVTIDPDAKPAAIPD